MKVVTFQIRNPVDILKKSGYQTKDFAETEFTKEYPKGRFHAFIKGMEVKLHYDKIINNHHNLTSNLPFLLKEREFIKSKSK